VTVIAVSMFRDEADVASHTVGHLLAHGVDHVIVADNRSTDATATILSGFGDRVTVAYDAEPGYYQDDKMTRLATQAADMGADWVLPFDADEVWYPVGYRTLAEAFDACTADVVAAPGYDHIRTAVDADRRCPFAAMPRHRQQTQQMPKVAFRPHPDARLHMGNHDVDRPGTRLSGPLAFRHFQYRTLEQMARKLRNGREAYEASDIHPMHGTHWREGGLLSDVQMADRWDGLMGTPHLVDDPVPAWCCR